MIESIAKNLQAAIERMRGIRLPIVDNRWARDGYRWADDRRDDVLLGRHICSGSTW